MDLEEFHRELRSDADFEPRVLNLDAIMTAGGRLRRRRRLTVAAGAAAVAIAVVAGLTTLVRPTPQFGPSPAAPTTASAAPSVSVSAKSQKLNSMNGYHGPIGTVIDTGLVNDKDQEKWTIFGVRSAQSSGSRATGLCLGTQNTLGDLTESLTLDDVVATPPGFHDIQAAMSLEGGVKQPAFGYYAGTPARITVSAAGRTVDAQLARWSEDANITVFWFPVTAVKPDETIKNPKAYDIAGATLAAGQPRIFTY
ncbi:hypothetical protein Ate02nite_60130 [Paractinoplanes tereljensis]|uniref:Uncharacterized protein n=2 Tax=Paractinoplanes tereljensis TaxID=571912 RepID=A0A919TU58_9ACTN|nr:hypothetical protein Ate02nite_60130 [Actinoplanes tereljensis]